jgi:hypothetical protein
MLIRHYLVFFFIVCTFTSFAQSVKEMHPTLGLLVDKSVEGEIEFNQQKVICEKIWNKLSKQSDYQKLSVIEKKTYSNCDETKEDYWDILGVGCSWYCGFIEDSIISSSSLSTYNGVNYSVKNIHDLNYKTAWIEGVPGYGAGEYIVYHFPPQNPRITEIIIVNGYVKSPASWKDNSRVKKLKMYVDNKPYAILNLADNKREQHFKFEPLGYSERENLEQKSWWTIKFEILEVYFGDKYDDTAITEIYFDGIDVH